MKAPQHAGHGALRVAGLGYEKLGRYSVGWKYNRGRGLRQDFRLRSGRITHRIASATLSAARAIGSNTGSRTAFWRVVSFKPPA